MSVCVCRWGRCRFVYVCGCVCVGGEGVCMAPHRTKTHVMVHCTSRPNGALVNDP